MEMSTMFNEKNTAKQVYGFFFRNISQRILDIKYRISSIVSPPLLQRANSVIPYIKPRRCVCDFPMRDAAIDQDLGEHLPVFATNLFLQRVSSQNTILT